MLIIGLSCALINEYFPVRETVAYVTTPQKNQITVKIVSAYWQWFVCIEMQNNDHTKQQQQQQYSIANENWIVTNNKNNIRSTNLSMISHQNNSSKHFIKMLTLHFMCTYKFEINLVFDTWMTYDEWNCEKQRCDSIRV